MIFKKTALIASALLVAVAFSGCSKKPRRPNPMDTVMNGSGYGNNAGADNGGTFNPADMGDAGTLTSRSSSTADDWTANVRSGEYPTIYFTFDSSSITPQERSKLDDAASRLRGNPRAKLLLEGHCDWRGTAEYNLALGDRRAKAVRDYLLGVGVEPDRLQTRSKGDLGAPEGASSAQMARDRRVDILVAD